MTKKLSTIVLIDDDEVTNYINNMIIDRVGCAESLNIFQSGVKALEYLRSAAPPDIIFLDINMPGMNGWEFIEEYKEIDSANTKATLLVMLTTSLNPDDEKKAKSLSVVDEFRHKPLSPKMITELIEEHFGTGN